MILKAKLGALTATDLTFGAALVEAFFAFVEAAQTHLPLG